MKHFALVVALVGLAACTKSGQSGGAMSADTSKAMMADTSHHMMMADTAKKADTSMKKMAPATTPKKKTTRK